MTFRRTHKTKAARPLKPCEHHAIIATHHPRIGTCLDCGHHVATAFTIHGARS